MTRSGWPVEDIANESETARLTIPSSSDEGVENTHLSGINGSNPRPQPSRPSLPSTASRPLWVDWLRDIRDTLDDSQCCFHCCACSLDFVCGVVIRSFAYLMVAAILISALLPGSIITPQVPIILGFTFFALLLIGNICRILVERHLQATANLVPISNLNTLEGFWARRRRTRLESRTASTLRALQFAARIQELREEGLSERQLEEIVHMTQTGRNAGVAEVRLILGRQSASTDTLPPPARVQDINRLPSYAYSSTGKKAQIHNYSDNEVENGFVGVDDDDDDIKTAIRLSLQDQASHSSIDITAQAVSSSTTTTETQPLSGDAGGRDSIVVVVDKKDKDYCTICLDNFKEGATIRILPCFHSFCSDCVDPWLQQRSTCPVCKNSIFHTS